MNISFKRMPSLVCTPGVTRLMPGFVHQGYIHHIVGRLKTPGVSSCIVQFFASEQGFGVGYDPDDATTLHPDLFEVCPPLVIPADSTAVHWRPPSGDPQPYRDLDSGLLKASHRIYLEITGVLDSIGLDESSIVPPEDFTLDLGFWISSSPMGG